jgi:crotonobetainyl-CoA:carnitine CoA-transferase CaiB-like acyl-CoA transferase
MLPLTGIRVIELGQNLAGPYCGFILACLGAEVIKVERPGGGDDARGWGPPFVDDTAAVFHAVNANKASITVDFTDAGQLDWLAKQIGRSDAVFHNLRPGVVDKLGLDGATLTAANPRLVYANLSAFGRTGPMRHLPGYEPMVQAVSSLMWLSGEEGAPPYRIGTHILDHGTGMWAAIGILAALLRRAETGRGGIVDASLFETGLGWVATHIARYKAGGGLPRRHPSGANAVVVFEGFETRNGPLIIAAANDRLFAKLAGALGRPEWGDDPRYKTNRDRVAHKDELIAQVAAIIATETKGTWIDRLEAAGVPCAPIQTLDETLSMEQVAALDILQQVPGHELPLLALPLSFDGERPPLTRRAPAIGQDNARLGAPIDNS